MKDKTPFKRTISGYRLLEAIFMMALERLNITMYRPPSSGCPSAEKYFIVY